MSEYRITDIHSHILFGVDDGSKTIEESLKMLIIAQQQGVKNVFCTPHSGRFDAFVYNKNFTDLTKRSEEEGISIRLFEGMEFLASELYRTYNINASEPCTVKTLNNTEYVLLEFYWYMSCEEIFSQLECFINRTGKKVIISHIERYRSLHTDDEAVKRLKK